MSLPTRERGLKLAAVDTEVAAIKVAPYAGAWIETSCASLSKPPLTSRSLRGSVD